MEQWSEIQDEQDELWHSEIGEETPTQKSTYEVGSNRMQEQQAGTRPEGSMDLGDLVNQRNAEHQRSQPEHE